jgi:predicted ester cyclase
MKKLLFSATAIALMVACEQQPNVSSYPGNQDSAGVSPGSSAEAREEQNKETALASINMMASGNVDSAFKNVSADAVEYGDGSGPAIKNVDSIKASIKQFIAAFPDYKGENFTAVADGDQVFVYGDWSGTFKNDFWGMKATNKSFKIKDVDIFKFNDKGQITEHRSVVPWNYIMSTVDAQPPKK